MINLRLQLIINWQNGDLFALQRLNYVDQKLKIITEYYFNAIYPFDSVEV